MYSEIGNHEELGSLMKKHSGLMTRSTTSPKTSNPLWSSLREFMKILKRNNNGY